MTAPVFSGGWRSACWPGSSVLLLCDWGGLCVPAELAQKARKEIADYLAAGKDERARIRVEHIIREDYLVEAMEILELYCDLLLARFGLIQSMK